MWDIRRVLAYMALGALAFWLPDIVVQANTRYNFSSRDAVILIFLLPVTSATSYGILRTFLRQRDDGPSLAFFMLLGIWVSGPLFMMIGATFSGGGFAKPYIGWLFIISFGTALFPIYTFILSGYDGSAGGLIVASVLLMSIHLKFETKRWVLSPGILRYWNRGRN